MAEALQSKVLNDEKDKLTPQEVMQQLESERLIGMVRTSIFENVEEVSNAFVAGGIHAVLISISVPQPFRYIETFSKKTPHALVGACHVANGEQAQKAIDAGAQFVSGVFLSKDVTNVCRNSGVLVIQGAQTPTEVMEVVQSGADMVHLFPIGFMGGAQYIRTIRDQLPTIKFVASGGVQLEHVTDLIRAGVACVVVDDAIADRGLIRENKWKEIAERAKLFSQKIAPLKASK